MHNIVLHNFTIKILQLQHVLTLFESSSGSANPSHVENIGFACPIYLHKTCFIHISDVHSLKITKRGSKHVGVVIF